MGAFGSHTAKQNAVYSEASSLTSQTPILKNVISKATYDKVKSGMSYKQVEEILGLKGKQIFESGEKGDEYYMAEYEWTDDEKGHYITMSFLEDKLETKTEYGLE